MPLLSSDPPAMSTFPLGNNVAVGAYLAAVMLPVAVNSAAVGSYNSALERTWEMTLKSPPPAMSTFLFVNKVAAWPSLGTTIVAPVGIVLPRGHISPQW